MFKPPRETPPQTQLPNPNLKILLPHFEQKPNNQLSAGATTTGSGGIEEAEGTSPR